MPATTNFQQWNPTKANQEDDATYTTDPQRTGGAANPSIFPSATANKLFYQLSTFVAAFGAMLAAKGITTSDADFATLVAALGAVQVSGDEGFVVVPFSGAPTFDASAGRTFQITLTGNINLAVANVLPGMRITMIFIQDGSGGHTVTYPANVLGAGDPAVDANAVAVQEFIVDSGDNLRPLGPMTETGGPY